MGQKRIWFWAWLLGQTICFSQDNLVPNGTFDESLLCPGVNTIAHWFVPQNETVQINNLCPYVDWWRFIRDPQMGLQGSQCGFVETYYRGFADDNIYSGRLYLAVKLQKRLTKGTKYYVEMWIRAVDTFPNRKLVNTVFTNGQDIAFSSEFPLFDFDVPRNFLSLRPTVASQLQRNYEWHKVSTCFEASGHEEYMIIGNFRNDANTETSPTGKSNPNFPNGLIANYAVDNVVLTAMEINLTDTSRCVQDSLVINAARSMPPDLKYRWQDGSSQSSYLVTRDQKMELIMEFSPACILKKQFEVKSYGVRGQERLPIIRLNVCKGSEVQLSGSLHLANESLRWADGTFSNIRRTNRPGTYQAIIQHKCGTEITKTFEVQEISCIPPVFVPNAFTPNRDGLNDEFLPLFKSAIGSIDDYELRILDRWGNLLFTSTHPTIGWSGENASSGVYIYRLRFITQAGEIVMRSGDFSLWR
jgi:gliding motility-associated-like protein